MAVFPSASRLYRNFRRGVILAGLVMGAGQILPAQMAANRPKPDQGPRALGLLEIAPNGKAHLVPIAIMYDGEFYDAGVYKASPVPMALEPGTVYEAERTGSSLGLFTISGDVQGHNEAWIAEGTFEPAGSKPKSKEHVAEAAPRDIEEKDSGPPKLRRPSEKPKPSEPAPATPSASAPPPAPSSSPAPPPTTSSTTSPQAAPTSPAPAGQSATAKSAAPAPPAKQEDVYRPILRRGKGEWTAPEAPATSAKTQSPNKLAAAPKNSAGIQLIPAISDAGGPEPHPYTYPMKPEEEQQMRKKMLAIASADVLSRAQQLASEKIDSSPRTRTATRQKSNPKPPQPVFDNVQLHVLDLSLSNEPVAILTATAHMPPSAKAAPGLQYYVALVAHADIYGDLHKAFSQVTDDQHLDLLARYEFIDAVDADGDGRGDLLFRTISDAGKAYTIYRLIGDQVWPLFEGTPGQ